MTDLGTTDGIGNSEAVFINSKTQIVGYSFPCDLSLVEAFLWENGSTVNLNTLISFHSVFHLDLPAFINDRGEIGVFGSLANGDSHALLLIPCDENHPDVEGCDYSLVDVPDALVQTSAPIRNTFGRTLPQLHNRRMSAYYLPGTAIGPNSKPEIGRSAEHCDRTINSRLVKKLIGPAAPRTNLTSSIGS
jgi:probable HAF family extracellular repeat protein